MIWLGVQNVWIGCCDMIVAQFKHHSLAFKLATVA